MNLEITNPYLQMVLIAFAVLSVMNLALTMRVKYWGWRLTQAQKARDLELERHETRREILDEIFDNLHQTPGGNQ